MAIAIALFRFNDLGLSVTPIHLAKNEENLSIGRLNFWKNLYAQSSSVLFSSSLICVTVSNVSWMVKFCENVGNIWNYWHKRLTYTKYYWDSLSQLIYLWNFMWKTLETMLVYTCQFFKIRLVLDTFYHTNEVHDTPISLFLKRVIQYLFTVEVWRKSIGRTFLHEHP